MFVYMHVENITGVGQALHQGTHDWILVEDCRFGFMRTDAGAVLKEGEEVKVRAIAKAIVLSRRSDAATTKLNEWLTKEDPRTVQLEFCIRPDDLYLVRLDLSKAQLRSYQVESRKDPEGMYESYQLDYEDLMLDYWEQAKTNRDKDFGRTFQFASGA